MKLRETVQEFFARYGTSFTDRDGNAVLGMVCRREGENEGEPVAAHRLGLRPADHVCLLTQGDIPLSARDLLSAGQKTYALISARPVRLGDEILYYKSIAYEQEEET